MTIDINSKFLCAAVAVAAMAATAGGCAGGTQRPGSDSRPAEAAGSRAYAPAGTGPVRPHGLDLVLGDCSSFRRYTRAFASEMVLVAADAARRKRLLWGACFDGAPLRTLRWSVKVDFGSVPPNLNSVQEDRFNLARALGLKRAFLKLAETPEAVSGSGQLEALEVAGQTAGTGRVFMFTDGAVNEVDGVDLRRATPKDVRETVDRWTPRLRGLQGVDLMLVGVGRGTGESAAVRNAEALFRGLATRVGVRSFTWTLELPATFGGRAVR